MADRPPSARQDAADPPERTAVEPLQISADWLPVYMFERRTVDSVLAFLGSTEKEEAQVIRFLRNICALLRSSRRRRLTQGLDLFCQRYGLAERIKALLEEEPRDPLRLLVWRVAMHTIAELSSVDAALQGRETNLLHTCFSGLLLVPPEQEMPYPGWCLYYVTMESMDVMIDALVVNSPACRVSELLQSFCQMLLAYISSDRAYVQDRAMGRLDRLSSLLSTCPTLEPWHDSQEDVHGRVSYRDIHIPVLGRLLGHLLVHSFAGTARVVAGSAVSNLESFLAGQNSRRAQGEQPPLEEHLPELGVWSCARYLSRAERTDIMLVFMEAMTDTSIFDKEQAAGLLDAVMEVPDLWLADLPKIVTCIHENLGSISTAAARQKVLSLLLLMANGSPGEVVATLLRIAAPGDRTAMAMWEVLFSTPQTLKIVKNFLQDLKICEALYSQFSSAADQPGNPPLAVSAQRSPPCPRGAARQRRPEDAGDESRVQSARRDASLATATLLLEVLVGLSERPDAATQIQPLLPQVVGSLDYGSAEVKRKALALLVGMLGRLEREEASAMAAQLAGKLLPLFDHGCSQLRELSMRLFGELVRLATARDKKRMKSSVRRALLPLCFHLSDQSHSVAEVAMEALLGAAELLQRRRLGQLLRSRQTWRVAESLLQQERSRAEELLAQSLPYLGDAQPGLREAAVRFIGLAARTLRERREDKVAEICRALQLLEMDTDPCVCSLATQTLLILATPRRHRRPPWALCCWPRGAGPQ